MAELVNQRIEDTINELEQMRRTNLYEDDEIREIARKRKEFEYKIQRRVKSKEDFAHYIAYELALLEDINIRRKQAKLSEKKKEIEYAITKRLNKMFKQFIYRFQNDIEVYFQYIKFCISVGFSQAVSGIIGQMLQIYGDKPTMWLMASKWENDEQRNPDNARSFLLKGIHRHPESDILYLELFKIELLLTCQTEDGMEKEKQMKRADVVWKNALKNVHNPSIIFKCLELAIKYDVEPITNDLKKEIWNRKDCKDVWSFIASKELEGCHWTEVEDLVEDDHSKYSDTLKYMIAVFEEALQKFSDEQLCTKYIHQLLGLNENQCTGAEKVEIVKQAWFFGHELGVLSNEMYEFGITMLKMENETTNEQMLEILNSATKKNPSAKYLWKEKLVLCKTDEKGVLQVMKDAEKGLQSSELVELWNLLLDQIESSSMIRNLYKKFQTCESAVLLSVKPKLLQKIYEHSGLKAARELYEEFVRTPPIQLDVHTTMIDIEQQQDIPNNKQIRKCYECLVQHCGSSNADIWTKYMNFEKDNGNAHLSPAIYRRAVATLKKELVDDFIKTQTLSKIN